MANILDYIYWRGDLSFKNDRFNILDNLIFCEMTYVDFDKAVPSFPTDEMVLFSDVVKKVFELHDKSKMVLGLILPNVIVNLVDKAQYTERFGKCKVSNYVNIVDIDTRTQFSAVCFHFDQSIYISYRGTDDTLIGWQENVDMLYSTPVGSQVMAVDYLNQIARLFPKKKIYVGGHSKGGNLANYAAIYADDEVKERIVHVYSNDGPGMRREVIDESKYLSIKSRITRIIPESDCVGMLFEPYAGHTIITKSSAKGLYQHDGFSWQIKTTEFDTVQSVSKKAKKLDTQITKMIEEVPESDKIILGQNIYDFILASQLNTLLDCKKESIRLIKYLNKFSGKSRHIFLSLLSDFMFF